MSLKSLKQWCSNHNVRKIVTLRLEESSIVFPVIFYCCSSFQAELIIKSYLLGYYLLGTHKMDKTQVVETYFMDIFDSID